MADYQALLRTQVGRAISILGTINSVITFSRIAPGNYDPVTGLTADVPTTIGPFKAPIVRIDHNDIDLFPGKKDVQVALIPYMVLGGYEPKMTDNMVADGRTLEIVRIRSVPTRAIYKVYVEFP
jgi:hypothetical protein